MTRETKIGLIIAGSFLCLVSIVIGTKMRNGNVPPVEHEEQSAANDLKKDHEAPTHEEDASKKKEHHKKPESSPAKKDHKEHNPDALPQLAIAPPNDQVLSDLERIKRETMGSPPMPILDPIPLAMGTGPVAPMPMPIAPPSDPRAGFVPPPGLPGGIPSPMAVIPPPDNNRENFGTIPPPGPFKVGNPGIVEESVPLAGIPAPMPPVAKDEGPMHGKKKDHGKKPELEIPPPGPGGFGVPPAPGVELKPAVINPEGPQSFPPPKDSFPAIPPMLANPGTDPVPGNNPPKEKHNHVSKERPMNPTPSIPPPDRNDVQPGVVPMIGSFGAKEPNIPPGAVDRPGQSIPPFPSVPPVTVGGPGLAGTPPPAFNGQGNSGAVDVVPPPPIYNSQATPSIPPPDAGGVRPLAKVRAKTHDTEKYQCQATDTSFAILSHRFYGSDKYAEALLLYNRDNQVAVKNGANLAFNPPALQPGQEVLKPPMGLLERDYRAKLGDIETGPIASIGGTTPPVRLSPPNPLPSIGTASSNIPTIGTPNSNVPSIPGPGTQAAALSRDYVVQNPAGEPIREVAQRNLGDPNRWTEIYRLNPTIQPQFPIPAGTNLRLP